MNVAEFDAAGIVTEAGTVNERADDATAIMPPPAGAGLVAVTVHWPALFEPSEGLHCSDATRNGAIRDTLVFEELPFSEAVMVADPSAGIVAVVMLNVAELEPGAAVTVAGTVSGPDPEAREIRLPPACAGFDSATVHVPPLLEFIADGVHCSEETMTGATRDTLVLTAAPLSVAVMLAALSTGTALTPMPKVADLAPAGTVTEVGAATIGLSEATATELPPEAATPPSVTLQLLDPDIVNEFGEQERLTGAGRYVTTRVGRSATVAASFDQNQILFQPGTLVVTRIPFCCSSAIVKLFPRSIVTHLFPPGAENCATTGPLSPPALVQRLPLA